MLTSIFQTLTTHLAPLDLPVHLADCVPAGTAFPYLTADVQPALTSQHSGTLTLTLWAHGNAANAERLTRMDQLWALLPPRGIRLATDSGALLLRLKSPAACVQDDDARGMQTVWHITHIPSL
ncbi:MAG: hypothetical protein IJD99_12760 [Clostridia bacterium]|nr:hypothetical protein [Clostridia bacterium]